MMMATVPGLRRLAGWSILAALLIVAGSLPARAEQPAAAVERITLLLIGSSPEIVEEQGGGLPRVAAVAKAERQSRTVLLLHGGDSLSTGLLSAFDNGAHVVDLLNGLEVDAMAVQPRELNYGEDLLAIRASEASFPFVSSNLRQEDGSLPDGVETGVILSAGALKIGVVSVLPPNAVEISGARSLRVIDPVDALLNESRRLRAEGAHLVVALTRATSDDALDRRIETSGAADIVVRVDRRDQSPGTGFDGRTLTLAISGNDAQMAAVDLTVPLGGDGAAVPAWTYQLRVLDAAGTMPDPEIKNRADTYVSRLAGLVDLPVALLKTEVDTGLAAVRTAENAFGNMVADAARSVTGADVALINGGQIRGYRRFPAGHVLTRGDVLRALPFRNRIVTVQVTGADLLAAMEHSLSSPGAESGRFLHLSGGRLVADMDRPPGNRIVTMEIAGRPVAPERRYRLAISDFMAGGGDGYTMLDDGAPDEPGDFVSALVTGYLREQGVVAPVVDGRLTQLRGDPQ